MSDRVQSRQHGGSATEQRMTKAQKRAAAKEAARKAAEAKRRRQALAGALAGLAVVAVIIAVVVAFGGSDKPKETASAPGASSATAAAGAAPTNPAFPPLPEGADPALAKKPATSAGTGTLTELKVTPLIEGKGPAVQKGQQITVNYVGVSYQTGEEFDASWKSRRPFSFQLGGGNVIPGWDQGLVGVKVGSRVQLDIPSDLAYGDHPQPGYPAGPLRFVVDVLAVQ